MKKFKTKGQEYTVKFNEDLDIHGHSTVVETLQRVFQSLIDTVTEGAQHRDLIRMVVTCPDYPTTLPFKPKSQLTAERFLSRIETVLQSYEEFTIEGTRWR